MTQPTPTPELRVAPLAVVVFYAILGGGGALAAGLIFDIDPLRPLSTHTHPWRDLGLGAAVGLATVGLSRVLDRYFEWSRAMTRLFKDVLGRIRPGDALVLAVASSIGEELLFRGLLLPWLGLWPSSLIFGVVHGLSPGRPGHMWDTLRQFLPLVLTATVMGFAFGLLVEYTGNILAPLVAHFTINYLNLNEMYRTDWQAAAPDGPNG